MKNIKILLFFCILFLSSSNILSQELIIGEERIEPGIVLIFEGAVKDVVIPKSNNLSVEIHPLIAASAFKNSTSA